MSERSVLRIRERPHHHPERRDELIIEVVRDGVAVATIYGSREGVHVVSERLSHNSVFRADNFGPSPALVVGLLAESETCPWCEGGGGVGGFRCPVCSR